MRAHCKNVLVIALKLEVYVFIGIRNAAEGNEVQATSLERLRVLKFTRFENFCIELSIILYVTAKYTS